MNLRGLGDLLHQFAGPIAVQSIGLAGKVTEHLT